MSKIYDLTPSYRAGRRYVNFAFKRFYSKFIVLGKENIPSEGPVIFAPNHLNALMDALVVLLSTPRKYSDVFIARSDIFKNKFAAKALRFLKILPAFRIRDGYENLGKNDQTFDEAREVLEQKNALGIMPEGNQGEQRKLRPMVKGIFRIAFSSQEQIGDKDEVKIVPVGLDYSDITRFGEEVIVNFGKPIYVNEYMPLFQENPALAMNQLRSRLSEELHGLTVDLATEKYYDCFETTAYTANTAAVAQLGMKNNTVSRFYARQKTGNYLVELEATEPEKVERLDNICAEYKDLKEKSKLTTQTLEKPMNFGGFLVKTLGLLVTLPVFIAGFLLNMFPFFLPGIIRKKMGVKYRGFFSSFDFVLGAIITFPIFYLLQTVLFAVFSPTPWWVVPIFAVAQYILGTWAFCWAKSASKYFNKLRYAWLKVSKSKMINELQTLRNQIISYVNLK
ncbi:hypothetical protein D0T49_08715 [Paludibacter sp. 221]|uniref:1-acyl-sn-glycerol-3-phosphate acyltransferase n=1 Tax=Paludibacter sp. 221 TaxID=2302939 RepID=UPI0013D8745D|nr:1-acyl-sn-glycerol-3-phosphate acyltransferase [Paludibacter sp. 221]NDV47125.1 hypothetical protein [Paludibacter sp. 221]